MGILPLFDVKDIKTPITQTQLFWEFVGLCKDWARNVSRRSNDTDRDEKEFFDLL
ncbi:hypothetical protein LTR81_028081, partial [Elasticomyces elasticus]